MNDDRTKADKAWEARQEAARYRIFDAATKAAEATDEADDEKYFAVLDQAGNAAEAAAAKITGYKTYVDLLETLDTRRKHFRPFVVFTKDRQPRIILLHLGPLLTITLTHFLVHGLAHNEIGAYVPLHDAPSHHIRRPQSSTLPRGRRAGPATRSHKLTPVANPVDHILLFWDR